MYHFYFSHFHFFHDVGLETDQIFNAKVRPGGVFKGVCSSRNDHKNGSYEYRDVIETK